MSFSPPSEYGVWTDEILGVVEVYSPLEGTGHIKLDV